MFRKPTVWAVIVVLFVLAAACSSGNPQPPAAPPTATAGPQAIPPTNTLSSVAPTDASTQSVPTKVAPTEVAPTVEPPQPTATTKPPATLTRTPKPRLAVTVSPHNTITPLNVTYEVAEIKRLPGDVATLVLKVYATGGSGGYRYYHDDIQQTNSTYNIAGICGKPFVHTIKVTSGDGQTIAVPYHVNGICPTPTP